MAYVRHDQRTPSPGFVILEIRGGWIFADIYRDGEPTGYHLRIQARDFPILERFQLQVGSIFVWRDRKAGTFKLWRSSEPQFIRNRKWREAREWASKISV